ncbi:hypothetical protein SLEP1_g47398 [Rubroshorea leprosula]|uniref:Sulfotransferase n=1 Tax=Rubroshorea leprosula TaxID=152421 RepID=A0AAV5LR87_9ROSI|nr:hypothetical protein SLEP1_g47398 [Rubroshorea leprosula]
MDDEEKMLAQETKELLLSLPKEKGWRTSCLYKFQGFWCQPKEIQSIISFQNNFQARETDVVLATIPKSGTTWIKALTFSILNRRRFPPSSPTHPLFTSNPHDLVPFFEYKLFSNSNHQFPDLSTLPNPRLFATHLSFHSLNESVKKSGCPVVYVCRNPFDTFVSSWHYLNKLRPDPQPKLPLEQAFELYCKGVIGFGPFWEHMLGYWNESRMGPQNVLFFKYEDMKQDTVSYLKILARFLGMPFTEEEEEEGVVEEIVMLCSFEKMKDLEVNKSGKSIKNFENRHLFRKAEVGDWVNHLPPAMVEQLSKVMEEKLGSSGLKFRVF